MVLSATMVVLVAWLFHGHEPVMEGISEAGVLQLAWLFARSQADHVGLMEVEIPTSSALRKVGKKIMWTGSVEENWEMRQIERDSNSKDA
jgi:hypothetical protein